MEPAAQKRQIAIIGGGISGLSAAYYAVTSDPNAQVTVIEESGRFGGKIQTVDTTTSGKSWADRGAEFVDSTQTDLIELCNKLGVKLIPTGFDNTDELFRLSNGKTMDADSFYQNVERIKKKIAADKEAIAQDPYGKRAQQLDNMSVDRYLSDLALDGKGQSLATKVQYLFKRLANWVKREPKIDKEAVKTLASCYTSESGNDPKDVSALQYVREASSELDALVSSDCAYRIDGGTETLIKALHDHLEKSGRATFLTDSKVTAVQKQFDDTFALTVVSKDGQQTAVYADQAVLAVPSYALKNVQGLDNLGFSDAELSSIGDTQYTNSAKFTVKLKEGNNLGDVAVYSHDGWQAWRSATGDSMTFLVGGKDINGQKAGKQLVAYCLDEYAKSVGTTPDKLFDSSQIVFDGVNKTKACYASPKPGQGLALSGFTQKAATVATQTGLGMAGTYLAPDDGIGFMNNGIESAMRAIQGLNIEAQSRAQDLTNQRHPPGYHVAREASRASSPALAGAGIG